MRENYGGGPSYPTTDSNGTEIEISSGTTFYLKVPKDVMSVEEFQFTVKKEGSFTYSLDYSYTEKWTTTYSGIATSSHQSQTLGKNRSGNTSIDIKLDTQTSIELPGAELPTGNLKIEIKDYDTGDLISGATVSVVSTDWYDNDIYTISGSKEITNLPAGATYTVTQLTTADGYKYELQTDFTLTQTATIPDSSTVTVIFENRQYGDLKIKKLDASTGVNHLAGNIFSGVEFKISYTGPRESKEYTETTDSNAEISLKNIPKVGTYTIKEISLPSWMYGYYGIKSGEDTVELISNWEGTVTECNVYNQQIYVDVSGYVWEDGAGGKGVTRDDMYNYGEILIENIPVYLKNNDGTIAQTKTNSSGAYYFSGLNISYLSQYSIEFEYNGLKYENVAYKKGYSKAAESKRTEVNNNFSSIYGSKNKNDGNIGVTGKGIILDYANGSSYNSTLVQNTSYVTDSLAGSIDPTSAAKMLADTKTAGYTISWSAGTMLISGINFGIYERSQIDLAVATDIENVEFIINKDYKHTYEYNGRATVIDKGFDVSGKNSSEYKNVSYERQIYDSYIAYTKNDPSNEDRLRVYVTYKIKINGSEARLTLKNYADTRLTFDSSYYDSGENIKWTNKDGVWQSEEIISNSTIFLKYELSTDAIISLATLNEFSISGNVTEISSYTTKEGKIDSDSAPDNIVYGDISTYEDDTDAAPNVKFTRKDSKVISGFVFEETTDQLLKTNEERIGNTKYDSSDKKVENVEVQIVNADGNEVRELYNLDEDGNVKVTKAQYLTSTDGKFEFTGLVPGAYYVQYTYGNYEYNNLNTGTTETKQTKIGSIDVTTESYKSTIVDESKYKFLINNNVENSTGYSNVEADYNSNPTNTAIWYWYQKTENSLYSSAVDDSRIRSNINSKLSTINNKVKVDYDNIVDDNNLHYMKAYTGYIDFPIEDVRVQKTDMTYIEGSRNYPISFGIVERPRQSIEVDKTIGYVKVTLANGQILAEGDPRTDVIPYVTYPGYQGLKIEVDNTIIEGAKLDVTYEINISNKSEKDYNDIKYYRYGDSSDLLPVKLKLNSIADYVDEKVSITYDIGEAGSQFVYYNSGVEILNKWQLITSHETYKLAGIPISNRVYESVKDRKNIVVMDTNTAIGPGEDTILNLSAEKLLTNLVEEDQLFDNHVEIIEVSNSVGRFYGEMNSRTWKLNTPGNYDINNIEATSELDNNNYERAHIVIVNPTGVETIIIYSGIVLVCFMILAGGIILIKKKVLG